MSGKKKLLMACNKGISSKYVFHTLCDIAIPYFEDHKDEYDIYFLSSYSTEKKVHNLFKKEKRKEFFHNIILYNQHCKNLDYKTAKDWSEIYDNINLDDTDVFDKVIEIGSALSEGAYLKDKKINYNKLFYNTAQFKYLSVRSVKQYLIFLYKIAKRDNILLEHYLIDPQEFNYFDIDETLKYERYFQYTSERLNFERKDNFLNTYKEKCGATKKFIDNDLDFVFGYTVLTKDRENNMFEYLSDNLKDLNTVLLVKDKYKGIDTFITKDKYLELLQRANYTLIIPAYDNTTFSIYRYIESIYNNCLPLILDTNDLTEVRKSIYIPDEIIISLESICDSINTLDHEKLLQEIKNNL